MAAAGTAEVINHLISICPHQTRSLPTHTWPTPASPALAGGVEATGRGNFTKNERKKEREAGGTGLEAATEEWEMQQPSCAITWCTSLYPELVRVMCTFNSWLYARTHTWTHTYRYVYTNTHR